MLIWGFHLGYNTATAFPTDYIPTTTATVTQAADSFSFPFTQTTFSALVGTNGIPFDGTGAQRVAADYHYSKAPIYIVSATTFRLCNGTASY